MSDVNIQLKSEEAKVLNILGNIVYLQSSQGFGNATFQREFWEQEYYFESRVTVPKNVHICFISKATKG